MSSFKDTLNKISDLEQQIESLKKAQRTTINEVVSRYIVAIEPTYPIQDIIINGDEWSVDSIGGYVHVNLWYEGDCIPYGVPLEYFTDESALKAFEEERKEERKANETKRKEERERKEYERLKQKFEGE